MRVNIVFCLHKQKTNLLGCYSGTKITPGSGLSGGPRRAYRVGFWYFLCRKPKVAKPHAICSPGPSPKATPTGYFEAIMDQFWHSLKQLFLNSDSELKGSNGGQKIGHRIHHRGVRARCDHGSGRGPKCCKTRTIRA